MIYGIAIILGMFVFVLFLVWLFIYMDWNWRVFDNAPRISFKVFYAMYQINCDSWYLQEYHVLYTNGEHRNHVDFATTLDYIQYRIFRWRILNGMANEESFKASQKLRKALLEEIQEYKVANYEEFKKHIE